MKRNNIYIIIISILLLLVIYILRNDSNSTLSKELSDFAVKDTSLVDQIFIADKSGKQVLLQRDDNGKWKVNKKYFARKDGIDMLLGTMSRIAVMSPVSKSATENVFKEMAAAAKKVEIYEGGELSKIYYVGSDNREQLGTYMLMDGSSVPFVVNIPGFNGYVSVRYFMDETDWRDKTIFKHNPQNIFMIKIKYSETPENSFTIFHPDSAKIWITNNLNDTLKQIDTSNTLLYINSFHRLNFESFVNNLSQKEVDSIYSRVPFCSIEMTDKNQKKIKLDIHLKPSVKKGDNEVDQYGLLRKWDVDHLYAFINGKKEMVAIQYFVFGDLLKKIDFFYASSS